MIHHTKHNIPKSGEPGKLLDHRMPAPLTRGAESAIVWFKQFKSVMSIPDGSGESAALRLLVNVAELL